MEETVSLEPETKDDGSPSTIAAEPARFGRRQHRLSSNTDSIAVSSFQLNHITNGDAQQKSQHQDKWVDDIVADVDAIPEMADAKDDCIANLFSTAPAFKNGDSIQLLKELDGEIGLHLGANDEGIDLSMLTRMIFAPELLEEPDVAWKMDLLMSEIASEAQIKKESRSF